MNRVLSIFIGLAVIVALVAMIGMFTRTPRFAELRESMGRRGSSETDALEESAEPIADA
jgi:hypothetical protein